MSNYLSVAAVTEILKEAIADSVSNVVPGVKVSALRPKDADTDPPEARVNLYLYQSNPNPAFRNEDLPTRSQRGDLRQRPRAVLDLDFLISFYGDHSLLEHQRLMGGVVTLLHAQPLLSPDYIDQVIQKILDNDPTNYLGESDLSQQPEAIRLTPVILNLEETSKIWSVFFQVPHALSIAYRASAVFLEPDSLPTVSVPVATRNLQVSLGAAPFLDCVLTHDANRESGAILPGSDLCLLGDRLAGDTTLVRVDTIEIVPDDIAPQMLGFTLPAGLPAGSRRVQVVHRENGLIRVVSNSINFSLRPVIQSIETTTVSVNSEGVASADVTVQVQPALNPDQRVLLKLNERPGGAGNSYVFEMPPVANAGDPVVMTFDTLPGAEYLLRIEVDGAESVLESIAPANNGDYAQPLLNLTPTPLVLRASLVTLNLNAGNDRMRANVEVFETIINADSSTSEVLVVGATVTGTWTLPDSSTVEEVEVTSLGASGNTRARFRQDSAPGTWTFTIDDVSKPGYSFDPVSTPVSESITI